MSSVFSEFVRSLDSGRAEPEPPVFEALLDTLRRALAHELKKRSLWRSPPSYLGVYGGVEWTQGDVLEDLLLDCYEFIFVRRLRGLSKQQKVRPNIDGLIFLNIRHFLHGKQKRHDPLGFRVFEVLRAAVSSLVDAGVLHLLAGDAKIHNDTVLGFAPWHDPQTSQDADLRSLVATWNDQLLPDLITAWSIDDVRAKLEGLIVGLPGQGVEVFQFRDLIAPLKDDARARWNAIHLLDESDAKSMSDGDEESLAFVPSVGPDLDYETRQLFRELLECVAGRLRQLKTREKTKQYLDRLWCFLSQWAAESQTSTETMADGTPDPIAAERLPPATKLSELLGIPRDRIPGLKSTLGRVVNACREEVYGRAPKTSERETYHDPTQLPQPSYASEEGRPFMDLRSRREHLRLATGRAAVSLAEDHVEDRSPRPGDTFLFSETSTWPAEWLFVRTDPADESRVLVAPIDDNPLVGRRDFALGDDTVRCGCGTWINAAVLERGVRGGTVEPEALEQLQGRWSDFAAGKVDAAGREVEGDAEYQQWARALGQAQLALPGKPQREHPAFWASEPTNVVPFRPVRRWVARLGYGLAAGFAAVAVGLSASISQLRQELSEPLLVKMGSAPEVVVSEFDRTIKNVSLAATETRVNLYIILSKVKDLQDHRLELTATADPQTVLWRSDLRTGDSELLLSIPRGRLEGGEYRVELFGPEGAEGQRKLVGERKVKIAFH